MPDGAGDGAGAPSGTAYDYLLRMPLLSLTEERLSLLGRQTEAKRAEVAATRRATELQTWLGELESLREALVAYMHARGL